MHNYHDTHGELPPAYTTDEDGTPLLSWRVLILPFLEETDLYERFNLDEPWDSPNNLPLADEVVEVYATLNTPAGMTRYLTVRHSDSPFPGEEGISFADIMDGTSNTIMVVEVNPADAVVWTKPDDWTPPENTDEVQWLEDVINGGCYVAMCDGSTHFFDPFEFSYDEFDLFLMRTEGMPTRSLYNYERGFIEEIGRGIEDLIEDLIWEVLIDGGGFSTDELWPEPIVWDPPADAEWGTDEAAWPEDASSFGGEEEKDISGEVEILEAPWDEPAMPESDMMGAPMSSMPPGMGMPMDPMNPMGGDPMNPLTGDPMRPMNPMGVDPLNPMGGAFDGPIYFENQGGEEKEIDGFGDVEVPEEPLTPAPGMEADLLDGPWADMMDTTTDDEVEKNIDGEPTEISEMGGMSVVEDGTVREKDIKGEPADLGELFDIPDVLPEPEEPAEEEKNIASEGWTPSELDIDVGDLDIDFGELGIDIDDFDFGVMSEDTEKEISKDEAVRLSESFINDVLEAMSDGVRGPELQLLLAEGLAGTGASTEFLEYPGAFSDDLIQPDIFTEDVPQEDEEKNLKGAGEEEELVPVPPIEDPSDPVEEPADNGITEL